MTLSYLQKNIITDLGLEVLSPEEQEKLLAKIGQILFQKVMLRVMDELNEADQGALNKVLDKKEEGAVWDFLEARLPNLGKIVSEEINDFKKDAAELMKASHGGK